MALMSLKLRTALITAAALLLLWALAASWMMRDVQIQLQQALDERLALSAQMVSGLLQRTSSAAGASILSSDRHWADIIRSSSQDGIACEIRWNDGSILARTPDTPYSVADSPAPGYSTQEVDGKNWRIYVQQDSRGFQIMTADRMDQRKLLIRQILWTAGIPFIIAVVGGLLALWLGLGRGLKPLEDLRQSLHKRRTDDARPMALDARMPSELRPLVNTLNDVLLRLTRALHAQRAFTDAAAHELRTPATAIDTHLQVAQMTSGQASRQALAQALQGSRRLRHTLDQMMSLARSDAPLPDESACPSVQDAIKELLTRLSVAEQKRLLLSDPAPDAACKMPTSMLQTCLRNLLDNALRYSPPDSPVEIGVRQMNTQVCEIRIRDRGPGLRPEQIRHIGERFWRGDQGRTHNQGAGLGLSIVHAIAARYHAQLQFKSREGGGLEVILQLKA